LFGFETGVDGEGGLVQEEKEEEEEEQEEEEEEEEERRRDTVACDELFFGQNWNSQL
jgi:hypothetical protein